MKNLKHLVIYEAFASRTISKTLKYILKKLGKTSKIGFLDLLKSLMAKYDYPIDKIDDKWLKYLTKKDAILVRGDKKVDNKFGIYCIKFWFSLEEGCLGYTGVGNETYTYKRRNAPLTREELSYLVDQKMIPDKGTLIPVDDYETLKDSDKVVLYVSSVGISNLTNGTIFIPSGSNRRYVIQNNRAGNIPPDRDIWSKYGNYGWSLGSPGNLSNDHYKLHKYIPGNESIIKEGTPEPFEYNLPIGSNGKLTDWKYVNISTIEKSDFSIVLYFDDMSSNLNPSDIPSEKITGRKSSRIGATRFLTNEEIKNANLERYIGELIKKIGISKNELNPKNLQRVASLTLNGEFALISIRAGYYSKLYDFNRRLERLMNMYNTNSSKEGIEEWYHNVFHVYSEIQILSSKRNTHLSKNINMLRKHYSENKGMLEVVNKILQIGSKISDNVSKYPINTLSDLKMIYYRLNSIKSITSGDENDFYIGDIEDAFKSLVRSSEGHKHADIHNAVYYLERIEGSDTKRKEIMSSLENIERYVDSIFK